MIDFSKTVTVEDYCEKYGVNNIYDLDLLDTQGECSRLALPDGENSIWVCDQCGELVDPDEGCEHCEEIDPDNPPLEEDDEGWESSDLITLKHLQSCPTCSQRNVDKGGK